MKLRNKKTGAVIEVNGVAIFNPSFDLYDKHNKKLISDIQTIPTMYESLSELNEEWEDYTPKEPRIEHDDARKAFFNWASTNQIHRVKCEVYERNGVDITRFKATEYTSAPIIEFKLLDADVVDGFEYTIAELCGEEE